MAKDLSEMKTRETSYVCEQSCRSLVDCQRVDSESNKLGGVGLEDQFVQSLLGISSLSLHSFPPCTENARVLGPTITEGRSDHSFMACFRGERPEGNLSVYVMLSISFLKYSECQDAI